MTNEEADGKGSGPKKPVTATLDLYEAIEEGAHAGVSLFCPAFPPAAAAAAAVGCAGAPPCADGIRCRYAALHA
jgi:hypothetical protein